MYYYSDNIEIHLAKCEDDLDIAEAATRLGDPSLVGVESIDVNASISLYGRHVVEETPMVERFGDTRFLRLIFFDGPGGHSRAMTFKVGRPIPLLEVERVIKESRIVDGICFQEVEYLRYEDKKERSYGVGDK